MVVGIDLLLVRRRRASTPRAILALLRWHRTVTVPARSRNLSTFHLCKLTISLPLFSSILLSVQTPHDLKKDVDILRELEGLGIDLTTPSSEWPHAEDASENGYGRAHGSGYY